MMEEMKLLQARKEGRKESKRGATVWQDWIEGK